MAGDRAAIVGRVRRGTAPRDRARQPGPATASSYPGTLRIIAGIWRRRRLIVPNVAGVRPTPDRVRETLFNWLNPWLPGARCIDLFAGTGALCLEALSRGASSAVMLEASFEVATVLRENIARLGAEQAEVIVADALTYLQGPVQPFDIVFLDPPFESELIAQASVLLEQRGWIRPGGQIYIEAPRQMKRLPIPSAWELLRSQTAGQVGYHLVQTRS
jgi:16S rRNA (guanine966-N2)-methyltransferase